jgi:uncharacterized protein YjbI with pentapeptide repeats
MDWLFEAGRGIGRRFPSLYHIVLWYYLSMVREQNRTYQKVSKTVLIVSILSFLPMNLGQVSAAASCNLKAKRVVCPKADLRKANLMGANLRGANLRGANLEGVLIKNARDWVGADLSGANLNRVSFVGTSNYPGANLSNVKFVGAMINGTNFCGGNPAACAILDSADFSGSTSTIKLERKQFGQKVTVFMGGASFSTAILTNVKFNGADLTDSQFYKSNLESATFDGAIIAGAFFGEATTSTATFTGAIFGPGYRFGKGTTCPNARFTLTGPCP